MNELNNEIQKAVVAIADFWEYNLHDEYFLFIKTNKLFANPNYLFGNMKRARVTPVPKGDSFSEIPLRVFLEKINHEELILDKEILIPKIRLLSNDLIYTFDFSVSENKLSICMEINNMTYGKGCFYHYIIADYVEGQWRMNSGYTQRTSIKYNNISGSIEYCIQYIFETENELEHPYQSMIDSFPHAYEQTQRSILEINMLSGRFWV